MVGERTQNRIKGVPSTAPDRRGGRRAGGRGTRPAGSGRGLGAGEWVGRPRAKEQEEGRKVPAHRKALRKKQRAPEIGARGGGRTAQGALRARPRAAMCTVRFERGTAWARIFFHPLVLGLLFRDLASEVRLWTSGAAGRRPKTAQGHPGGVTESLAVSHRALCPPRLRAPSGFCEPLDGTDSELPGAARSLSQSFTQL